LLCEIVAAFAMPDPRQRLIQRPAQTLRPGMVPLQQVESHTLRRFRPDAGQAAQGFDQFFEGRWGFHEMREG